MHAFKMKSDILAIIIRATFTIPTTALYSRISMDMVWKSLSWIICAMDRGRLLTRPSCLLGAAVWEQDSHQYHQLTPCCITKTIWELPSKSRWPLFICKIWVAQKSIHLSQPSQVLLENSLLVKHGSDVPAVTIPCQPTSLVSCVVAQAL